MTSAPCLAADIFKKFAGIEVDFKVGLKKDELIKIIGEYDGLGALGVQTRQGRDRGGHEVESDRPRGYIGGRQDPCQGRDGQGRHRDEHAVRQRHHHSGTCDRDGRPAAARQIPSASQRTIAGEWPKKDYIGIELYAKTSCRIGAGNIGSIADRALGLKR